MDRIFLNNVDITEHVRDVVFNATATPSVLCSCGVRFTPPTNTPSARLHVNEKDMGLLCPACTLAMLPLTDNDPTSR